MASSEVLHWSPDLATWNESVGEIFHAEDFGELSDSNDDSNRLPRIVFYSFQHGC